MTAKLEVFAMILGCFSLFGTVLATALPMWKVSAFIGSNLIVMEEYWEGLWMNCYNHEEFRMQCKEYDSVLILPTELQAARALMCISVALIVVALLITGCGTRRCNCCDDDIKSKNITLAIGGCLYLLARLTVLIPVSWVGHTVIQKFYNPTMMDSQKRELGKALFLGWGTSGVLLITGIIVLFCYNRRRSEEKEHDYIQPERHENEASVYLKRTPSSFYKQQVYV
ncbi:claudin-17-like [Notolabrus celidotus]|uniref:claudin-17-like n=1 Tax=Notolabrus celidotus TaxID=1203425 RepID=UPI0014902DB6|nr:claudin-17-like [Notolabrus celidotus]